MRPRECASRSATFRRSLRRPPKEYRDKLIEAAAEGDEELFDKYLESGTLSIEEIKRGIRARCVKGEIVPVLCGSAFKNKGVQAVLDAVVDYLPAPSDRPPVKGVARGQDRGHARPSSDDAPFAALAFKIATDPFVGNLTFFRVYSGVLDLGRHVSQPDQGQEGAHRPLAADARERAQRRSKRSARATSPRPSGSETSRPATA